MSYHKIEKVSYEYDPNVTIEDLINKHHLICMDGVYFVDGIIICRREDFVDSVIEDNADLLKDMVKSHSIEVGVRTWVYKYGKEKSQMKYIVHIQEVWDQPIEIEANSKEEAKQKVAEGEGITLEKRFEYSYTLDINDWRVEKA
jgi:hypothetical protein